MKKYWVNFIDKEGEYVEKQFFLCKLNAFSPHLATDLLKNIFSF